LRSAFVWFSSGRIWNWTDHLRRRQTSAIVLVASSLLAIAISFVDPEVAQWALALNFALPLIRKWSGRAASLG
jgi:hypothetical protein